MKRKWDEARLWLSSWMIINGIRIMPDSYAKYIMQWAVMQGVKRMEDTDRKMRRVRRTTRWEG